MNGYPNHTERYYAETGQIVNERHLLKCKLHAKLFKVQTFINYAIEKISIDKWSPDIVVGRALKEGYFDKMITVCAKPL